MPESDATDREQQAPVTEGLWHDKILGDTIGYTKGLVAILDSLNEGFQRRGRELEEQRHRLTILQSERRSILEERAGLEAQIASLTADRDNLLAKLGGGEREPERPRRAVGKDQTGPGGRTPEAQDLRGATPESDRQIEDLRNLVRTLERQLARGRQSVDDGPPTADRGPRTVDDVQIASLTAERDRIQAALQEREETLQRQAARTAEIEGELQRLRDAASQQQSAWREDLADAENLLGASRKDLAGAQGRILRLERSLDEEHSRNTQLEERLRSQDEELARLGDRCRKSEDREQQLQAQAGEITRLNATVHAAQTLLGEIVGIIGGASMPAGGGQAAGREGVEGPDVPELDDGSEAVTEQIQGMLRLVRPIVEAVQEVLKPPTEPAEQRPSPVPEQPPVKERTEKIAEQWRRYLEERAELLQRARRLRQENSHLSQQVAAMLGEREIQQERQRPTPARDSRAQGAEAAKKRGQEEKPPSRSVAPTGEKRPPSAGPFDKLRAGSSTELREGTAAAAQKGPRRRSPLAGMTVECMLEGSGKETTRILRGEIARINTMGMMASFDERFPEGRKVIVRFGRGGEDFSFLGRVVRVQQSSQTIGASALYDHLIRFEAPMAGPTDKLAAFLS